MKIIHRLSPVIAALFTFAFAPVSHGAITAERADAQRINSTARLIAGIAPTLPAHRELAERKEWKEHGAKLQASWSKVRDGQAARVKTWRDATLPAQCPVGDTLLYPFSGPDFLNVYWLFPNCDKYILFGLEPIGAAPEVDKLTPAQFGRLLRSVRAATVNLFSRNYFITSRMSVQLKSEELNGIIPIMLIQMALSDVEIVDISPIDVEPFKRPAPSVPAATGKPRAKHHNLAGITIDFRRPGSDTVQHLQYFSVDVSNKGLRDYPDFLRYLRQQGPAATLVKSASYLMHIEEFAKIRNALLDATAYLVQDDTGVPYAQLAKRGFQVRVFGTYREPIPPFEHHYQDSLASVYEEQHPQPLPFLFGYLRTRSDGIRSNIMVGVRAPHPQAAMPSAKAAAADPVPVQRGR